MRMSLGMTKKPSYDDRKVLAGRRGAGRMRVAQTVDSRVRQAEACARARTLVPQELWNLQDIGSDADGDALGGFLDGVARKMRIARGRFDPAMTEEPADDRQAFAERKRP